MDAGKLYEQVKKAAQGALKDIPGTDIISLFGELYGDHPDYARSFEQLINTILLAHRSRNETLKERDRQKMKKDGWFLSNEIIGMSLYVDRFCGNLKSLQEKTDYFKKLGVNLLHLMPLFQSPAEASDGGYAVSDFRKVDARFGSMEDLQKLREKMHGEQMHLMLDIVFNHTSDKHDWAQKAKNGDPLYQDFFYMYDDRSMPDAFDSSMPEVFPESAPGNFTWVPECKKWVMTVFHDYQWDLNYSNPAVFIAMLDTVFFYANLGVDILRIDAPAFIWKQAGTTCQNLPQAHTILRLVKSCVQVSTPGMALLGEAIVAPKEIMNYFGTGDYTARECDFAYNATLMALQWDALATGDTRIMREAIIDMLKKPNGTSWITYTRCHDDIGLAYDDETIRATGADPFSHRTFLKNFYSGNYEGSFSKGALFSVNPKTNDARISGSLASLCGLEKALENDNEEETIRSINRIILMQAVSFFVGGLPMIFYGDESGHTNDYSYLSDSAKNYDNRWMHRPLIDWKKNEAVEQQGTVENRIFTATQKLIRIRKKLPILTDHSNISWMGTHNIHAAGFMRSGTEKPVYCVFNFKNNTSYLTWFAFREHGLNPVKLFDHWQEKYHTVGPDNEYLILEPYDFCILETV